MKNKLEKCFVELVTITGFIDSVTSEKDAINLVIWTPVQGMFRNGNKYRDLYRIAVYSVPRL